MGRKGWADRKAWAAAGASPLPLALSCVLGGILGGQALHAQPASPLMELFSQRAPVTLDGAASNTGLWRLSLPAEVLSAAQPGLADVRLIAGDGAEIPYLVETSPRAPLRVVREIEAPLLEAGRRENLGRGNDGGDGDDLYRIRESYEIGVPAAVADGSRSWLLVIASGLPSFVRQIEIVAGSETLSVGSVFRLPDGRARLQRPLPPLDAAVDRLTVRLVGTSPSDGGALDPSFSFRSHDRLDAREELLVELKIVERVGENGTTRLQVERPRGLAIEELELRSTTPLWRRLVRVVDRGPGGDGRSLGAAVVQKGPGREGSAPTLSIERPWGDRLELVIDDGDSPALTELTVHARLASPALVFAADAGADPWLYLGAQLVRAPRYDVAGLRPREVTAEPGIDVVPALWADTELAVASLGTLGPNPDFDDQPPLSFAMRPGAELDPTPFRFRRSLTATSSATGLHRLELTPEDLARARPDLGDLRLQDREGHQRAYLLREAGAREIELAVDAPTPEAGGSRYRFELPTVPVEIDALKLEIDADFFDRAGRVIAVLEGDDAMERVQQVRLVRHWAEHTTIELPVADGRLVGLELVVEDGDDAPLAITSARAETQAAELLFVAEAGSYDLLLGAENVDAPAYELRRVRDVVVALASEPSEAGPLEENPAHRRPPFWSGLGGEGLLLWVVLLAAVAGLALLTLRLAGSAQGTASND